MSAPPDFPAYAALADALIERATKDQLADVARPLALNIGWYPQRYGDVPQEALLKMVRAETLNDETLALLSAGMQNLVSALAEVTGLNDDLEDEPRHWPPTAVPPAGSSFGGRTRRSSCPHRRRRHAGPARRALVLGRVVLWFPRGETE